MAAHAARAADRTWPTICGHSSASSCWSRPQGCDFHAPHASSPRLEAVSRPAAPRGAAPRRRPLLLDPDQQPARRSRSAAARRRSRRRSAFPTALCLRGSHDPHRQRPHDPRAARHDTHGQELADRGAAAHADEQPRPGGRREAGANWSSMAASAARRATGSASTASSQRCASLEDDETLLVQSGKPVGVFRTHADAPRVLIANSNLVPHWATWEHFHELDRKGLMMYGQMTAGSWIYIGSQGIVQGTYETFVEIGPPAFRRQPRRPLDPDRRSGRHGRRAAAGRDHGRRLDARRRMPAEPHRVAPAHRLSRPAGRRRSTKRWRSSSEAAETGSRSRSACSAMRPRFCPSCVRRGVTPGLRHRPDLRRTIRSTAICRPAGALAEWGATRSSDPTGVAQAAKESMAEQVRAMLEFHKRWACRRSTTATTSGRWRRRGREGRLRLPGLRAGLYPPAVLPRHRAVPLGGAVGRSGRHLQDRREGARS